MAKFELKAGAKVDILNEEEMAGLLSPFKESLRQLLEPIDFIQHSAPVITVPTSGVVPETVLYRCATGFRAAVHRIQVAAQGYDPGHPLTTANAWLAFWRSQATAYGFLYGLPAGSSAVLPATITEGNKASVLLRNGDAIVVSGNLGTLSAATGLYISLQLALERAPGQVE